jgi:hypothetical protein
VKKDNSIFSHYYEGSPFIDRYPNDAANAVDVIIPVIHTNELWRANLLSYYREIPVRRLLIGDGGCIDDSLEVVKTFPRVEILDHSGYKSLGFSIRRLIEAVNTEYFVYLHSDVFLPPGWFDVMKKYQTAYDWFECRQKITALIEFDLNDDGSRALSGSQMGRKRSFEGFLSKIEDDYLYRNEDIILAGLMEEDGKKYGRVNEAFHYHQVMYKQSSWGRRVKTVNFELEIDPKEEIRAAEMQVKGLVKYMAPNVRYVHGIVVNMDRLQELGALDWKQFLEWIRHTNPAWLPLISKEARLQAWRQLVRAMMKLAKRMLVK